MEASFADLALNHVIAVQPINAEFPILVKAVEDTVTWVTALQL